jgi:hypothetical protein
MEEKEFWVDKTETERIRIARGEFKEKDLVDIRVYYQAEDGEWRPTKKGINISYEKFEEIKNAFNQLG